MNTPLEHANAVWRGEMSPQDLAGAIEAYTQELRAELDKQTREIALSHQAEENAMKQARAISDDNDQLITERDTLQAENSRLRDAVKQLDPEAIEMLALENQSRSGFDRDWIEPLVTLRRAALTKPDAGKGDAV